MRIALVVVIFLLLFGVEAYAETQLTPKNENTYTHNSEQTANNKEQEKPEKIISVKILPSPETETKPTSEEKKEQEKSKIDNLIAYSTLVLAIVTSILAIFTGALWLATRKLVIDTRDTSKRQLRAYLSVSIGDASYQERHKNIKFEVRPSLFNSGNTPAHNITYWARAE